MESLQVSLILVAESEALTSVALVENLCEAGFDAMVVVNAQDAIAELKANSARFRALLTDIRMPGNGNGWDVAHRARELRPSMPVIYMSGDSADQWRAHGVPGSFMLQKPFVAAQLITALTTLLNEADMADIEH